MMSENTNPVSADKPLTDPKDDLLGFASFAEHLADSICEMMPIEGIVLAIYGRWGMGKTTFLKFVVDQIKKRSESKQPIIMHFNPWWFSGHEDLTKHFFDQLHPIFSKKLSKTKVTKYLKNLSKAYSDIEAPGAEYVKFFRNITGWTQEENIPELKSRIETELRSQERKILVVIDDIDRLSAEEIRQVFRTIKAVANFPNIIYLLAFDKDVVIKALEETQGMPGEDYLEKIVQVPFELPPPSKSDLFKMLYRELEVILGKIPIELFERSFIGRSGYLINIENLVTSPRDVIRLSNTLRVTYPQAKDEVNAADFVAIEAIRVFHPNVYYNIRGYKEIFTGYALSEKDRSFFLMLMDSIQEENKSALEQLLKGLFPKLQSVNSNLFRSPAEQRIWRINRRICSREIFDIYFRLSIPKDGISNLKLKAIVNSANDRDELTNALLALPSDQIGVFFERLEDFIDKDIPLENVPRFIEVLLDISDELTKYELEKPSGPESDTIQIGMVILGLIYCLGDKQKRFEILYKAASTGQADLMTLAIINELCRQQRKFGADRSKPESEWFVSAEHLSELEKIALEKIRKIFEKPSFFDTRDFKWVFQYWRELNDNELKEWVKQVKNIHQVIKITDLFCTFSLSTSEIHVDINQLKHYFDIEQILDEIKRAGDLTPKEQATVSALIKDYNAQN